MFLVTANIFSLTLWLRTMADLTVNKCGVYEAKEWQLRAMAMYAECLYLRHDSAAVQSDRFERLFTLCDQEGLCEYF
jgi:hypothetical protein